MSERRYDARIGMKAPEGVAGPLVEERSLGPVVARCTPGAHLGNWQFMARLPLLLLVGAPLVYSQSSGMTTKETLLYTIDWRLFSAGKAKIEFVTAVAPQAGYQVNLHLESTGIVSKLFKVADDYSSNVSGNYCAETLQMTALEGSRQRETKIAFDGEAHKAIYVERDRLKNTVILSKETEIPACVHDVAGGLFLLRTLNLEPGQSTMVPVSDGKKSVMAKVEAQAREDVKTPEGTFKTIRYEVYLFDGVLYRRPAHLNVWLSEDRRKLPVQIRVRMAFTVGTINLLLEKHE